MAITVVPLDKAVHDRTAFDCGTAELNEYLRSRAARHQSQRVARVFVLMDDGAPSRILGFYALSNSSIAREDLSEREAKALPRHPIPTVTLGRLAVDRGAIGKGYGSLLLADAIRRCALVGEQSGVYALVVDAKNQQAKAFYERFGFTAIVGRPLTLYLPLATALRALLPREG